MRNICGVAVIAGLLAGAIPQTAFAQGNNGPDDKSCDKAAKIVSKGHPEKKNAWALAVLFSCGKAGANALVTGMPQYVSETDTLALDAFFTTVDNWRDGAIMSAALDIAGNPGASVQARVYAIRHLVILVRQRVSFLYGDISAGPTTTTTDELKTFRPACRASHGSELPANAATPLPTNYVAVIKSALDGIASASSNPAPVRNAAACVQW